MYSYDEHMIKNGKAYLRLGETGQNDIVHWLTVFVAVVMALLLGQILFQIIANAAFPDLGISKPENNLWRYLLALSGFVLPLLALFWCTKTYFKRPVKSAVTAASKFRWRRLLVSVLLTVSVLGCFAILSVVLSGETVHYQLEDFPVKTILLFLTISLLFLPIQCAAEEVFFRGYLNQAVFHFSKSPWFAFIVSSLCFMALHAGNPEAQNSADAGTLSHILMMSNYFLFGIFLSVIVYFEGGLEAAIGVHTGNNLFAATVLNYEGSVLETPSIFLAPKPDETLGIGLFITLLAITVLLYATRNKTENYEI